MAGTIVVRVKLVSVAFIAIIVGVILVQVAANGHWKMWQCILTGFAGVISMLISILSIWMTFQRISYGHGLISAYIQFTILALMVLFRYPVVNRCIAAWKNPRKAQEDYLKMVLKANLKTDYAKDFGLSSVMSLKDLKDKHPLTSYERYRPYVDRMAKGEQNVLTGERTERFALTSGTTGKAKMIPYGKSLKATYSTVLCINMNIRMNAFGLGDILQQEAMLYTAPKLRHTEAGIIMGPASMIPPSIRPILVIYASPADAFEIEDPIDSIYVHLLFGLRDPNLRALNCNFTPNLMSAMRMVEQRWSDIVRDIELGMVSTTNVSSEIHQSLVKAMGGGDPKRAALLKREFEKGFDGILKRVWPCLKHVQSIDPSGLKETLLKSYAKGLPLYGQAIVATEGIFGVNMWPHHEGKDEYVLMPTISVLEFIPEDKIDEDQPETLSMDELQVGGVYEVVITSMCGLYRFRFGDILRVRRYHFNTPVVEFMYRSGQILNVHSEKLDQSTVQDAIEAAVGHWPNVRLEEYAVAESILLDELVKGEADPRPYYLVFLELDKTPEEEENFSLDKVDDELRQHSFTYNSFREKGSIAPPLVHIVKPGTFDRLHDFILDNSTTTANQYKVPRKLRTTATLKLMLDSSVCSNKVV